MCSRSKKTLLFEVDRKIHYVLLSFQEIFLGWLISELNQLTVMIYIGLLTWPKRPRINKHAKKSDSYYAQKKIRILRAAAALLNEFEMTLKSQPLFFWPRPRNFAENYTHFLNLISPKICHNCWSMVTFMSLGQFKKH